MSAPSSSRRRPGGGRAGRPEEHTQQERLEQFHAQLTEEVLALATGPAWAAWLATAARFHHYSFRNTLAIWMQRPDATHVAGYRTWQALGRQVRKGERGIQILAPVTARLDSGDSAETGAPGPNADAPHSTPLGATPPPGARRMVGVRLAHVFDISQTDGDPLPGVQAVRPVLLTGQAPPGLWDGLAQQIHEAGYTVTVQTLDNGVNGLTDYGQRQVTVAPTLDPAHQVKPLAHELGHVLLHQPEDLLERPDRSAVCRGSVEVEAESIAFLITSAHGMDPGAFSVPYLASWTRRSDDVEATVQQTATRVLGTAHRILDRFDRDNPAPLPVPEDLTPHHRITPAAAARPQPHHPAGLTPTPGVDR